MNVRKNIDYSEMYAALDDLMVQQLSQMELYCEIGKVVCRRTEKGAAVIASEYLNKHYPDVKGFSPRNLRRMRDFYRTYENYPKLLSRAMQVGWTQNTVILEAELNMELREWYMKATEQFGWSKTELIAMIASEVHLEIVLDIEDEIYNNNGSKENYNYSISNIVLLSRKQFVSLIVQQRCRGRPPWYPSYENGCCIEIWEKKNKNPATSLRLLKPISMNCLFREMVGKLRYADTPISSYIRVI